jgi:uncharacterized membrane protein YedE/YeeE
MKSIHLRYGIYGLLLGLVLSRLGFSDYGEVHKMFVFSDFNLFLAFCTGTALSMGGFFAFTKRSQLPANPLHPGTIFGGVLFGIGWALTGACPSIVLVQIGEGQLVAIATLMGALVGAWAYPFVHRKFFRWDMGNCSV